ncbi:hypothetical protein ABIB34_004172 [Rhodococcus sp. UYP5]
MQPIIRWNTEVNGQPHGHKEIPPSEPANPDAELPVIVPPGEATTAKIAWCGRGPDQLGVYYGGSFKLSSREILTAFLVTRSSMDYANVNCIFRTIVNKTAAQHSFAPQSCR